MAHTLDDRLELAAGAIPAATHPGTFLDDRQVNTKILDREIVVVLRVRDG